MKRPFPRPLVLALLLAASATVSAQPREAPGFRIPDLDGKLFDLRERRGEVVLLNFWATWCIPCITELEAYRILHERHSGKGFLVVAVSVDQPQTAARVRSFAQGRAFPFPVLLDPGEAVYRLYGGAVMPTSVLIDRAGRIVHRKEGFQPGDEVDLERRILALLDEPAQAPREPPPSAGGEPAPEQGGGGVAGRVVLSGSNFLRANHGRERREDPAPYGWLEDWFDFRAANERLSYQARFRAHQFLRDLPGTRENLVRDPSHRVARQTAAYDDGRADVRAGNFYGTLNRGLVLRMFEDRQARIDRDVKGAWVSLRGGDPAFSPWGRGRASIFGGNTYSRFDDIRAMDADEANLRDTYLQGTEGEWEPLAGLTLGAQALEAFRDDRHVRLAAGHGEWLRGATTAYVGYAGLAGQDAFHYPNDFTGRALYAALSQSLGRLELGGEYKYYHNYDLGFAEPPSLVPFHPFRLTARDMLFPNNQREEGVQLRGAWEFGDPSTRSGRGGSRYALNVSRIVSHPERNPAFLVHHVGLPFLDVDNSLRLQGADGGHLLLNLNANAQRRFEAGFFEDIRALTAGAAGSRPLPGPWNVQWEVEAQRREVEFRPVDPVPGPLGRVGPVQDAESPWLAVLSGTLGRSSAWTITLDYEVTTSGRDRDPGTLHSRLPAVTNGWASAYFTLSVFEGHQIALWAGQRRERVVCSGGSCRIEPAFEGGELTWISSF